MAAIAFPGFGGRSLPLGMTQDRTRPLIITNAHHHASLLMTAARHVYLEQQLAGLGADAGSLELSIVRVRRPGPVVT